MNKYKVIMILGESGAGKDTLKRELEDYFCIGYNIITLVTTRPPRPGEVDGRDYVFTDDATFTPLLLDGAFLSTQKFNNWWYGVLENNLNNKDKINIVVGNPAMCLDFYRNPDIDMLVIYCQISDKVRLLRSIKRDDSNLIEICRRFISDKEDYDNLFKEYPISNMIIHKGSTKQMLKNPRFKKFIKEIRATFKENLTKSEECTH